MFIGHSTPTAKNPKGMQILCERDVITKYLQRHYGGDFEITFFEGASLDVNFPTCDANRDDSLFFRIKKTDYELATFTWRLKFSTNKAFCPAGMLEYHRVQCHVLHTINMLDFINACEGLRVSRFNNNQTPEEVIRLQGIIQKDNKQDDDCDEDEFIQ
ncbi:hypothetical protein Tco_0846760 [Tanacetum coccineum]